MSSTAKPAKDHKPFHSTPKLVPRQTAASAARAARIATSKINTIPTKQSSFKNLANPTPNSTARSNNNLRIRFSSKADLKHEVKQVKQNEDMVLAADLVEIVNHTSETGEDQYLIPDNIQEGGQGQITYINTPGILEEINENKALVLGSLQDNHTGRNTNVFESPVVQDRNLIEGFAQNRPQSAKSLGSRPNTPQNSSASTPQTPHGLSRPNTPTMPRLVVTAPAISRPNTPRRLAAKLTTPAITCKSQTKEDQMKPCKEDDLKTVYISKKKKFNAMKKDLDLKQREILEMFDNLRDLREQLNRDGISNCGDRHMNDLVLFNVADWTSEEIAQLCRDANDGIAVEDATDMISTAVTIDENALADLLANAVNVPSCFADLCLQAFTARQELIDWVKELIDKSAILVDDGSGECLERIANYNKHGLTMCDDLRIFKDKADEVVCTLCQLARRACRERSALFSVGETLVREIAQLRLNINDLHRQVELQGQQFKQSHISEKKEANIDLERELEEEKAANAALKDKLANTESQLRQARGRINKMDKQLKEAETSIANLTGTVKVLEDQSRQREVQLEARARKLKESVKSGEYTTGQLTQERDLLNEEIVQLKQRIETMQAEKKTLISEHNDKIKEMKASMEEGNRTMQQEMEKKTAAEKALEESKNLIDELKLKVVRLENSLPSPDVPTEREMDLWAQLQATKDSLRSTEDEITALRREKIRFIETLTKITEMENKVGMQQKLAAELLSKEEIFGKMQMQIRELTKNVKLNEQKVSQYEQYVKHLHEHTRAVLDCQGSAIGVSNQDLQHEVMNLKMNLLDAEHRNEELSELLNQKEQQLEQQDKTSRAQARVIKVREELINMLKNKETEQSRELSALQQDLELRMKVVDDVNKQIASKADEIQELFATLENKQQQIHRLEKIVLALEEQQRRAQAQRTRHEEKIAALEHELAAGNRRERRFLFF